ncbi:hypothetical protein ACF1BU_30415 [Streptomyces sp. NPDC014724]|uniref:hypothetical protein n=1 Tax=unclassified Streptomyces TaxID=2593676 RepID=UPI0036FE1F7F
MRWLSKGIASTVPSDLARQHLRAAVYLLNWLEDHSVTLAICRQTDIERWMTSDDARLRREAGHFVRCALSQKSARDLTFPAERWNGPSGSMDEEARRAGARRLLHDNTLKSEVRLVGLLLLLYAQCPQRSPGSPSTTSRRRTERSASALGAAPVDLPATRR